MLEGQLFGPKDIAVVAGGGGFIGGALVESLLGFGCGHVRAVDNKPFREWHRRFADAESMIRDLRQPEACYQATEGATHVFNLAADMGGMGFIETHKADCMLSVLISTNMLLAAKDNGVRRFFYSSSACVYNIEYQQSADVVPLRESAAYPALPEDGYGWEKLFTERMCRHFDEEFDLPTRVARYHNVYGPHGTWEGGREKAPAAISRKVAEAVVSGGNSIDIWGDGEQTRSFMFIDDCIEGTIRLTLSDFPGPVNLGSDRLVTINQLVSILEDIAGVTLKRNYDLSAPKGVRGRNSDNTLVREKLGWKPQVSLEEGLERTYRWVYDQVVSARGGL